MKRNKQIFILDTSINVKLQSSDAPRKNIPRRARRPWLSSSGNRRQITVLPTFTLRLASLAYQDTHPSDMHSCVTNELRLGTSQAIFITGEDGRVRLVVRISHLVLQSNSNSYGPQLPRM